MNKPIAHPTLDDSDITNIRVFYDGKELTAEERTGYFMAMANDVVQLSHMVGGMQAVQLAVALPYAAALITKIMGRPGVMTKEVFLNHCALAYDKTQEFFAQDPELKDELDKLHKEVMDKEKRSAH
jgi:hypothetical protein